jgi:hypothetical protein
MLLILRVAAVAGVLGAIGCSDSTGVGSTDYVLSVQVKGSHAGATNGSVQMCVDYKTAGEVCGPIGGFAFNSTGQISLKANPGEAYTVVVPSNQPIAAFCSVTAGGSGQFGPTLATAVVTCA